MFLRNKINSYLKVVFDNGILFLSKFTNKPVSYSKNEPLNTQPGRFMFHDNLKTFKFY